MAFGKIKRKLFSTRSSSKGTAITAVQVPASQICETLVVHKSRIHLQPPNVLGPKSSLSEASNPDSHSERCDFSRPEILLNVLPIIKELIGRCEDHSNDRAIRNGESYRRSPKFAYLGRASAAISLLEEHLAGIQRSGQADQFNDTINQLASCLESMLVGRPYPTRLILNLWSSSLT